MTIQLDSITLNPDLQLDPPLYGIDRVEAASEFTRGGDQIIWERVNKSVAVNLVGGDNWGGLDRQTLASLYALVNVADASYTLAYHGTNMTVRWRHEERPVISCRPVGLWRRDQESTGDWFVDVALRFWWEAA